MKVVLVKRMMKAGTLTLSLICLTCSAATATEGVWAASLLERFKSLSLSWGLRGGSSAGIFIPAPLSPQSSRHGLEVPSSHERPNKTESTFEKRQFEAALERVVETGRRTPILREHRQAQVSKRSVLDPKSELSTSDSSQLLKKVRRIETLSDSRIYGSEARDFVMPMFTTKGAQILRDIEDLKQADYLFEVFPTQAEAFRFADCRPSLGLQVFAADKESNGAKKYVVATYKGFWHKYKRMPEGERHLGEVIRRGATCRLYFDLEFRIPEGADRVALVAAGDARVDQMLLALEPALRKRFAGKYVETMQVLELDSSTDVKFSRHLIVPNVAFRDNAHAGAFVRHLAGLLPEEVRQCIDLGVYTKNRCFRMLHSSKLGKAATFELSGRAHPFRWEPAQHSNGIMRIMYGSRLPGHGGRQDEAELLFLHSLICFTTHQHTVLEDPDANAKPGGGALHLRNGSRPLGAGEIGSYKPSPFPELDRFVVNKARRGAQVKQWTYLRGTGTIHYALLRNRYCERVGRFHRSNHVNVVVDLAQGCWRQQCLDGDCAGYRGREHRLPADLFEERLLQTLEREEARALAKGKIREALEALVALKGRRMAGTLTAEDAARLAGAGVRVGFNATHATLYHCKELWRELRGLGFAYDIVSKGWVQALPAVAVRAGLSNSNELTRERLLRLLESAFLAEEGAQRESDSAEEEEEGAWEGAVDVRVEEEEEEEEGNGGKEAEAEGAGVRGGRRRVVVVRSRRPLGAGERSRLWNSGFKFEAGRGVWEQGEEEVMKRARQLEAEDGGARGGEEAGGREGKEAAQEEVQEWAMAVLRRARVCRVEVQGETVTVWDAPVGAARMEAAGFREVGAGSGGQGWWRGREEVAEMLGLVSAVDISAEGLLAALERGPEARTATPPSEGSEELQRVRVTVTRGTVEVKEGEAGGWAGRPGRVVVEAPRCMREHLQGLGFRRRGGEAEEERVVMMLTEAEVRHLIRMDFAGSGAGAGEVEVTEESVRRLIERSAEVGRGEERVVVRVRGGEVIAEAGYGMREMLRGAGLRWSSERRAWAGSVEDLWGQGAMPAGKVGADGSRVLEAGEAVRALQAVVARRRVEEVRVEVAEGGSMQVFGGYEHRKALKARGFKWNVTVKAWERPVEEVRAMIGGEGDGEITLERILDAEPLRRGQGSSEGESSTREQGGGGGAATGRSLAPRTGEDRGELGKNKVAHTIEADGMVRVLGAYQQRKQLKERGFRWDAKGKAWVRSSEEVRQMLGIAEDGDITLERILEVEPQHLSKRQETSSAASREGEDDRLLDEQADSAETSTASASSDGLSKPVAICFP